MINEEAVKGDKYYGNDENNFYCDKCYAMVNYLIEECHTISIKSVKLGHLYTKSKQERLEYKTKLKMLQFEYDEIKAIKEELEEKFYEQNRQKDDEMRVSNLKKLRINLESNKQQ